MLVYDGSWRDLVLNRGMAGEHSRSTNTVGVPLQTGRQGRPIMLWDGGRRYGLAGAAEPGRTFSIKDGTVLIVSETVPRGNF
ncbi:MAG: hypothetical protein GXX96_06765 [Planctomycetaceae bacterium]|jgi:hypothetical protein|nr:hypothetical protein [Planctomycetaceae bacterium]